MTNFLDTGGKLPAGPPYREWVKKHQEILLKINRNRYWHDFAGQPRRNPTKQPLLHNGKKPR